MGCIRNTAVRCSGCRSYASAARRGCKLLDARSAACSASAAARGLGGPCPGRWRSRVGYLGLLLTSHAACSYAAFRYQKVDPAVGGTLSLDRPGSQRWRSFGRVRCSSPPAAVPDTHRPVPPSAGAGAGPAQ